MHHLSLSRLLALLIIASLSLAGCAEDDSTDPTDTGQHDGDASSDDVDWADYSCTEPAWTPGVCAAGVESQPESQGTAHVSEPEAINYTQSPPTSGAHRPQWARWGEYAYLPPQRWLHNAEHGGVVLLYHPCADPEMIDALRALARGRSGDETGALRWVLTPYVGLPTALAVVAWDNLYTSECFDAGEIEAFIDAHYRTAPEDVASDGAYDREWIGR